METTSKRGGTPALWPEAPDIAAKVTMAATTDRDFMAHISKDDVRTKRAVDTGSFPARTFP